MIKTTNITNDLRFAMNSSCTIEVSNNIITDEKIELF